MRARPRDRDRDTFSTIFTAIWPPSIQSCPGGQDWIDGGQIAVKIVEKVSRSRSLGRALIVAVAVALVGGLAVDGYFWYRAAAARRASAPADIVVASPSPSP